MKKTHILISVLIFTSIISCSKNESEIEEICTSDNYTIEIDRFLTKLKTTHPEIVSTSNNYEYSYNDYNLLVQNNEHTFKLYKNYNYCNNNLIKVDNNINNFKYSFDYDISNRITAYSTTDSYLHDYILTYNDNKIIVSGIINTKANTTIILETNVDGLVKKIARKNGCSTFKYDANGNLIIAKDFDMAGILLKEYKITYDANPNPFYGQLKSIYIERFINYFSDSVFNGIDVFFRDDQFRFPYLKNNPVLLELTSCPECYTIIKRTYEYDTQNYPTRMEESYVGAPVIIYEYQYLEL